MISVRFPKKMFSIHHMSLRHKADIFLLRADVLAEKIKNEYWGSIKVGSVLMFRKQYEILN